MSTFIESFVRAYAKQAVERIEVVVDNADPMVRLYFAGRTAAIPMGKLVLQEESLGLVARAVDSLLVIPSGHPDSGGAE